ncbi:hypothetical protein NQ314_005890 [Rhamnusium bicolor]|uniref:Uncharacterized protein n=1 Tax=Rhamnusium bicolor TaxID=1586634 RepID=A0AAV8ZDJ1_9CUCU|nr:hypothetical protein NQ314_005890 [Rhamnusium bicolor]
MSVKNEMLLLLLVIICIKYTYSWSYNPYCWLAECCNKDAIPGDINKLRKTLKDRVYGQHLVETVVDALAAHWSSHYKPSKALTLSFHGWAGSGKNYVSKFIAESLYKRGTKSKHVHHFIGRIHFPLEEHTEMYKENLYIWLKGNITNCAKQLFIFDQVDKMPANVLNAIKPIIDYRDVVDGVDYTKAIFIFLSNTGSGLINEYYEEQWNKGKKREELRLRDFENLIAQGAFNEEDHYIPFLPMQESHVIECIRDEFRQRGVMGPSPLHINEAFEFIQWGPDHSKLFSKTGCKRISAKVGVLVAKYYRPVNEGNDEL